MDNLKCPQFQWMMEAARAIHKKWVDGWCEYSATGQQVEDDIEGIAWDIYYHYFKPFYSNDISNPEDCICGPGKWHLKEDCPEYKFGHDSYPYYGGPTGRLKLAEDCVFCKRKGHPCHEKSREDVS